MESECFSWDHGGELGEEKARSAPFPTGAYCSATTTPPAVLPDPVDLAGLRPFHAAAVGQRHAPSRHRFKAAEVRTVDGHRFLQHARADDVDAQAARQFDRGAARKAFHARVGDAGAAAADDLLVDGDTAGQRDRSAVVEHLLRHQRHVHLPHQLAVDADVVLLRREFGQRRQMDGAGRHHDRVGLADLGEQRPHLRDVADVGLIPAAAGADRDDLMTLAQFRRNGLADRAVCADDDNFFHAEAPCVMRSGQYATSCRRNKCAKINNIPNCGLVIMDKLRSMEIFVAVVDAGSFTAAAQAFEISPVMVGKHVGQLEERLGARLLTRTTRRQSLTEIGRQYVEQCRAILAQIQAAESGAEAMHGSVRGRLKITAPVSFGSEWLGPAMTEYLARHPDVGLDLALNDRVVDIVEEGYDAAIRIGKLEDSGLVARALFPYAMVICASPAYLKRRGKPRTPADLVHHECLDFMDWPQNTRWRLKGGSNAAKIPPARLRANNRSEERR